MKFSIKKKLNLSRIDREMWPYEDEVYEALEADSLDEAQKEVDRYYAQREGYFKAISEARRAEASKQATLPLPIPLNPTPLSNSVPMGIVAPSENPVVSDPRVDFPNQVPVAPIDPGVSNLPPKEFN